MKVLMVCLGNICRSPLAHGLLAKKVQEQGLNWIVDSAGTGPWHVGELPDDRSIKVAKNHGLDITYQRARQFSTADFEQFDHIIVMDTSNYQDVLDLSTSSKYKQKVKRILDFLYPNESRNVPDPYYGGQNGFEEVYQMLDAATDAFIQQLD